MSEGIRLEDFRGCSYLWPPAPRCAQHGRSLAEHCGTHRHQHSSGTLRRRAQGGGAARESHVGAGAVSFRCVRLRHVPVARRDRDAVSPHGAARDGERAHSVVHRDAVCCVSLAQIAPGTRAADWCRRGSPGLARDAGAGMHTDAARHYARRRPTSPHSHSRSTSSRAVASRE